MNTFAIKIDHQLNNDNLLNGRFFFGNSFQSAPATVGELTPANGPADMFNSVTNPTRVALVGFVWNATLSSGTLLETRFGYTAFRRRSTSTTRSIQRPSASTPARSTQPILGCQP